MSTEDTVARNMHALWKTVLEVEDVAPDDNFFALGGDSLKAMALMVHIEESFSMSLDPVEIFETPVFSDFTRLVAEMAGAGRQTEEAVL